MAGDAVRPALALCAGYDSDCDFDDSYGDDQGGDTPGWEAMTISCISGRLLRTGMLALYTCGAACLDDAGVTATKAKEEAPSTSGPKPSTARPPRDTVGQGAPLETASKAGLEIASNQAAALMVAFAAYAGKFRSGGRQLSPEELARLHRGVEVKELSAKKIVVVFLPPSLTSRGGSMTYIIDADTYAVLEEQAGR